jgi:hypothetical protein
MLRKLLIFSISGVLLSMAALIALAKPDYAPLNENYSNGIFPLAREVLRANATINGCGGSEWLSAAEAEASNQIVFAVAKSAYARTIIIAPEIENPKNDVSVWVAHAQRGYAENVDTATDCTERKKAKIRETLEVLTSPEVREFLLSYPNSEFRYDEPWPLFKNRGVKTYSNPQFQKIALKTIGTHFPDSACIGEVRSVELLERKEADVTNLPPFILRPINYKEVWIVDCGEISKEFTITFMQDSDGSLGNYSIGSKNI